MGEEGWECEGGGREVIGEGGRKVRKEGKDSPPKKQNHFLCKSEQD